VRITLIVLRALITPAFTDWDRQPPFTLANSETTQALDILVRVVAVSTGSAPGEWHGAEPFAKAQPARAYAELVSSLADCECLPRFQHAGSIEVIS